MITGVLPGVPQPGEADPTVVGPAVRTPDGEVVSWPVTWRDGGRIDRPPPEPTWTARFEAAARLATLVHPGPVGQLVERELRTALVAAGRFGTRPPLDEDALLVRVVDHVLNAVEHRLAVVRADPRDAAAARRRWAHGAPDPLDVSLE